MKKMGEGINYVLWSIMAPYHFWCLEGLGIKFFFDYLSLEVIGRENDPTINVIPSSLSWRQHPHRRTCIQWLNNHLTEPRGFFNPSPMFNSLIFMLRDCGFIPVFISFLFSFITYLLRDWDKWRRKNCIFWFTVDSPPSMHLGPWLGLDLGLHLYWV